MAGKFVEMKEAAQMLGVTPDELNEMREAGQIHGYRDGASWKFKPEEIERAAKEREGGDSSIELGDSSFSDEELDNLVSVGESGVDLDKEVDDSSILISDEGSGKGEGGGSSTVIGKDDKEVAADSDLKLADSGVSVADSGSEISLVADESSASGSDVKLVADDSSVSGADSDLKLKSGDEMSDEFDLSGASLSDSHELELSDDAELELSDDDDLLLGGGSGADDVTFGASDSGISLGSPSDSGLSLEGDSELAASSSSLELPEDEELVSMEAEEGSEMQQDEEFLLTPTDELMGDEASDSGSQVIALEDSEAFDEDAATMVKGEGALLEEDQGLTAQLEEVGTEPVMMGPSVPTSQMPEAPYSIFNVAGLFLIVLLLGVTGMLMTDVVRNMWSWQGTSSATTSLMEFIVGMLGMN